MFKKRKKKLCIFTLFNKQTVINTEWVDFAKQKTKNPTDVSFFKNINININFKCICTSMQKAHFHSEHLIINVKNGTVTRICSGSNLKTHRHTKLKKRAASFKKKQKTKTSPKMVRDKDEEHKELNIKGHGNRIKATMVSLKYMRTQR